LTDGHVTFVYRRAMLVAKIATRFSVLFAGVVVFARLATELHRKGDVPFDGPVLRWLHERRTPDMNTAMTVITELGATRVLIPLAVITGAGLWFRGNKRAAIFVWVTGAGAGLMNQGLKAIFERARPDELLRLAGASGFAFPSGHSMGAAAVYGALAIVAFTRFPRVKWPAIAACAAIVAGVGVSRAYLYVHYPSDVLAGWALGFTWPLWLKHPLLTRPWPRLWRGRKRGPATQAAEQLAHAVPHLSKPSELVRD
jgi:undecaprenyl-diphosphatase